MSHWNSFEAYRESQVLAATPLELVCILYRSALDSVTNARIAVDEGSIAIRSREISKAIAIIDELSASLDPARGGQISENLARLYDYMQRELISANTRQSREQLIQVEALLRTLLEAWTVCAENTDEAQSEPVFAAHY